MAEDRKSPPPLVDLYYPLLWAFDLLGRRLYGSQWTGNEINAAKIPSPEELAAARAPIESERDEAQKLVEEMDLAIRRSVIEDEIGDFERKKNEALGKRTRAVNHLFHIGELNTSYRERFAEYDRGRESERILIGALQRGKLEGQVLGGFVLQTDFWQQETKGSRYYLSESLAVLPRVDSAKRRGTIVINQQKFHEWLKSVEPMVAELKPPPTPEAACSQFLLQQIEAVNAGEPKRSRDQYRKLAQRQIPKLSKRRFVSVWDRVVPREWKQGGRPAKPK